MNKETKTFTGNEVEEWASKITQQDSQPLDDSMMQFLLLLLLDKENEAIENMLADVEKQDGNIWFNYRVLKQRLALYENVKIDRKVILFCALNCKNVAQCVMYAHLLVHRCKVYKLTELTIESMSQNIFPWGMLKHDMKHWEAQKVNSKEYGGSDNMLDYFEASKSLQAWQ